MTVEDKKITNVERVRAKVLAAEAKAIDEGRKLPRTKEEQAAFEKMGGVPLQQKDEAELTALMTQVAEQTVFARKELGEWSLVGRTHGADSPAKLDNLLVTLKKEKHDLKVELDEHFAALSRAQSTVRALSFIDDDAPENTTLTAIVIAKRYGFQTVKELLAHFDGLHNAPRTAYLSDEQMDVLNMFRKLGPNPVPMSDTTIVVDEDAFIASMDVMNAFRQFMNRAPQPSGLGATVPTTLQEVTPGGEAKATEPSGLRVGDRVVILSGMYTKQTGTVVENVFEDKTCCAVRVDNIDNAHANIIAFDPEQLVRQLTKPEPEFRKFVDGNLAVLGRDQIIEKLQTAQQQVAQYTAIIKRLEERIANGRKALGCI